MTTTADGALAAVKARLTGVGNGISVTMYWLGDDAPILPETPAAFVYLIFNNEGSGRGGPAGYGGGRGLNLYRSRATVEAYAFAPPTGADGMKPVMAVAETVAARLRSFRDDSISVFAADVIPVGPGSSISPPGLQSEVNNYLCAVAEIGLSFDQIG